MAKNPVVLEVATKTGTYRYAVVGSIYGTIINLEDKTLLNESLRYNRLEERLEYLSSEDKWEVHTPTEDIRYVLILNNDGGCYKYG